MEGGGGVEGAAGEGEEVVEGGVGFGEEVAVGVEGAVVGNCGDAGGVVVLGQVADCAKVVGEGPENGPRLGGVGHLLVGEDFIHCGAPQVAVRELGIALRIVVELEDDLANLGSRHCPPVEGDGAGRAVVDEVGVDEVECAIPVGVDLAGDPAIEVVVGVLDDLRGRAGFRIALRDADQPIAVVPLVLGDLAPLARIDLAVGVAVGPDVPKGAVALGVVLVPENAVGKELIVRTDDVAAANATFALNEVPFTSRFRAVPLSFPSLRRTGRNPSYPPVTFLGKVSVYTHVLRRTHWTKIPFAHLSACDPT